MPVHRIFAFTITRHAFFKFAAQNNNVNMDYHLQY